MATQIFNVDSVGPNDRATLAPEDDAIIAADVVVGSTTGTAITGLHSYHSVFVKGVIYGSFCGITLGGSIDATGNRVTIAAGAEVGSPVYGLQMVGSFEVYNRGTIWGESAAVLIFSSYSANTSSKFSNEGIIEFSRYAFSVSGAVSFNLVNSGIIDAYDYAYYSADDATDTIENTGRMIGDIRLGSGNDTYDGATGRLSGTVFAGNGNDTILAGIDNDVLNGDAGEDFIDGGAGNDTIDGGAGIDRLIGGLGNDTFVLGADADLVADTGGNDTITSTVTRSLGSLSFIENLTLLGADAINGNGNTLANTITGNDGNNILNGGIGIDRLIGGLGNDTFVLNADADIVTDTGGIDTIVSTVSRSLASYASIENLTLGSGAVSGTGNALANTITGNSGNNILGGGAGIDKLVGGAGNDTYVLGAENDTITDTSGIDTITTTVTRSMATYTTIENLTLLTGALNGTGNSLNNTILGNAGGNILSGAQGNDRLTGGAGGDSFVFNSTLNALTNVDRITDFSVADDTIRLENSIFTALGAPAGLSAAAFARNATGLAQDASDRIIYETDTGELYYDANGSAAGGSVHFATLTSGLALTQSDFLII